MREERVIYTVDLCGFIFAKVVPEKTEGFLFWNLEDEIPPLKSPSLRKEFRNWRWKRG